MKTKSFVQPIISLCLPTNGIIEWVFPVLESIYSQGISTSLFEVIVTNNGDNSEFHEKMLCYAQKHENLIYQKTNAFMFHNQLEALKLASGLFFKFVNHKETFTNGSLERMIKVVEENKNEKPVIYFSNGVLKKDMYSLNSFDLFVRTLGRFASWTTGVGIWKEDYKKIPKDIKIDKISPHSCVLFSERNKKSYLIENYKFSQELTDDHSKKGRYDLFKAFAVEELVITLNLYIAGDISGNTLKCVKKDYKNFLCDLYCNYVILHKPCSYDLSGFKDSMGIFYETYEIKIGAYILLIRKILRKILRLIVRK